MMKGYRLKCYLSPVGIIESRKWAVEESVESIDGRHVTLLLVVPRECVPREVEEIHGGSSSAHMRVNKELAKVCVL